MPRWLKDSFLALFCVDGYGGPAWRLVLRPAWNATDTPLPAFCALTSDGGLAARSSLPRGGSTWSFVYPATVRLTSG